MTLTPKTNTNDTPAVVAPKTVPYVDPLSNTLTVTDTTTSTNANPLSNTSATVTDLAPVMHANPLSNTPTIVEVLIQFWFILNSGEDRRPIDD